MTKGLDASYDKPSPAAMKALGFSFMVGYVSDNKSKNLTKSEVDAYLKAGLRVGLVWEGTGREALSPSLAPSVASKGNAQMDALGAPSAACLYVAVDFQPTATQLVAIGSFFAKLKKASKRKVGAYGSYRVIKYLLDHGLIDFSWQTYAWSNGALDHRANYYQYSNGHHVASGTVDYDLEEHPGGLWGSAPTPPAQPYDLGPYPGTPLALGVVNNDHVKRYQTKLNKNGYTLVADGDFGAKTKTETEHLQGYHKLKKDGVVGPLTWDVAAKLAK